MGILDLDDYKKDCEKQKLYETKLIEKLTKENKIKFLDNVVKRIKRRIEVLDEEISQNIPPQDESGTDDKEIDFYDEKTEKIIQIRM